MIDIVSNVRDYLGTVNKVCLHFSSISLILMENYLKTLPDLSICTFVPMEKKSRGHHCNFVHAMGRQGAEDGSCYEASVSVWVDNCQPLLWVRQRPG